MANKFGWQKLASTKAAQRTLKSHGYQPKRFKSRPRQLEQRAICPHCSRPTLTLIIPRNSKGYYTCNACLRESPYIAP